ncbi:hypothetical protein RCH06_001888 [Polaromonas sp. CG_9.5]|nr:hypothetical protein [Polaromonas sp. CG_9.5]
MNTGVLLVSSLSLLAGSALGALLCAAWLRRKTKIKPRLPDHWPLRARKIVSGHEKKVWVWLRSCFPDHIVMVKVPILRFTMLHDTYNASINANTLADSRAKSEHWLELLEGIYTTFTISTAGGTIIGCVDVSGKPTFTKGSHELKETLLLDCGIAYIVVSAEKLPTAVSMRSSFLGEMEVEPVEDQVTRGGDSEFYADMHAFTKIQAR